MAYILGIAESKRAQPSGIGGSLSRQSTIELPEKRDNSINSFPNFVRMRERSFPSVK